MAWTAITDYGSERVCLNPSQAVIVNGILATDLVPGTIVVNIAGVWTAAVSGTAAHKLMTWGVVGYRKRLNFTTGALKLITDAWDTSEVEDKQVPIILEGICLARIDDLGASGADINTGVMVGTNAGILKLQDNAQIDHGSLAAAVIDDDVWCIVATGKFKGQIWGGVN